MPTLRTIARFIELVEIGGPPDLMAAFYAENVSRRENHLPPVFGAAARERVLPQKSRLVQATCRRPVFVHGEDVVMRWQMRIEVRDGEQVCVDELMHMLWADEFIVAIKHYYDPAQLL